MLVITNFLPYEKPPVGDFSGKNNTIFWKLCQDVLCGALRLLPVYFPYDLSARSSGQKLAQQANDNLVVFSSHGFPPEKC